MKKIFLCLYLAIILIMCLSLSALADSYTHYITFTVTENSSVARTNISILTGIPAQNLISAGYLNSAGNETSTREGTTTKKYGVSTGNTSVFIESLAALQSRTYKFYTGYNPADSHSIIPGYNGYITIADNITEQGANFTQTYTGYLDTTAGTSKYVVDKKDYRIKVSENTTGTVMAQVSQNATGTLTSYGAGAVATTVYGVNWEAGIFRVDGNNANTEYEVTAVNIYGLRLGTPGTLTVSLRAVTGSLVTGADLISGTVNGNDWPLAAALNTINFTAPYYISNNVTYAIVLRATSGNASSYVTWNTDGAGTYPEGFRNFSVDSGATWTALTLQDKRFQLIGTGWGAVRATVTGISSGETTITNTSDSVNFWMTVGSSVSSNATTAAVTNNAYSWELGKNNVMPYTNNVSMYVGGNKQVYFSQNTIIQSSDLVDQESTGGLNNGVITWGANPSGINILIGSITSFSEAVASTVATINTANTVATLSQPSKWFRGPAFSGILTPELNEVIEEAETNMGMQQGVLLVLLSLGVATAIGFSVLLFTGSTMLMIVVVGVVIMSAVNSDILSGWFLMVYILLALPMLYLSRQN